MQCIVLIVSWNLARNTFSKSTHERAWHYLAALDPDVALVQEAAPPIWANERWQIVMPPVRKWGSAILAKPGLTLRAFSERPENAWERDGYLATGWVTLPDGASLLLGSVHAPWLKQLSVDYLAGYDPARIKLPAHRTAYYYDVPYTIYRDRVPDRFLVSGDWNVSPILWDQTHNTHEADFFTRAKGDGWVDCYGQFHSDEGQTWFHKGHRPYQMDHAFCDQTTALSLQSCHIDAYPAESLRVSDHAPLIMRLGLSSLAGG